MGSSDNLILIDTSSNSSQTRRPIWRLIRDDVRGPYWNMAVDEAILDAVIAGIAPPTLRIYRWDSVAVTLGRFQSKTRAIDLDYCKANDIPIVRRPTGGRAILHDEDQTLSIVVPSAQLGKSGASVTHSYRVLSAGIAAALNRFGIEMVHALTDFSAETESADCFALRTHADIISAAGDKLVGCAQRRQDGVILQQCSIRHRAPSIEPYRVFQGLADRGAYPLESVEDEDFAEALIEAHEQRLGIRLSPGYLTGWEEERAAVIAGKHFAAIDH